MDVEYAWEKFHTATDSLASTDEPIRQRLELAWDQLSRLDQEDVESFFGDDDHLGSCVQTVFESLSVSNGGAHRLDGNEAERVASCIVSLYDAVTRHTEPR